MGQQPPAALGQGEHDPESRCPEGSYPRSDRGIARPGPRTSPIPSATAPDEINHLYGGRGVYFDDLDRHLMEVITQPYGDTPEG